MAAFITSLLSLSEEMGSNTPPERDLMKLLSSNRFRMNDSKSPNSAMIVVSELSELEPSTGGADNLFSFFVSFSRFFLDPFASLYVFINLLQNLVKIP